jgi:hypothetical protein
VSSRFKYPQTLANGKLVLRDETGRLVRSKPAEPLVTIAMPKAKNWRAAIRRVVGADGEELWTILLSLARGEVIVPNYKDPDGTVRQGTPMVPSPEVRRAAAVDLAQFLVGKPVAQTEVMKSEEQAEEMSQLAALSDEQIAAKMEELVAANRGKQAVLEPGDLDE